MKTLNDLSKPQIGRITDLYRVRGAGPATVSHVARTWQITESDAKLLGVAATTRPKSPTRAVTETEPLGSAPPTAANNVRKVHLASVLAAEVSAAEAKVAADNGSMASLTTQQLEAIAARDFA